MLEENKVLRQQLDMRFGLENVVGNDHRMKRVFDMVDSVADTKATVLITGESGTGKSLIARPSTAAAAARQAVRRGRLRRTARNLLESELFGHVAGAFTGATHDKIGNFMQADGGTIFLDEIGTASPSMQVKLLRVLQELEFEQVGGTKTFRVDTRVILATNEDPAEAVSAGRSARTCSTASTSSTRAARRSASAPATSRNSPRTSSADLRGLRQACHRLHRRSSGRAGALPLAGNVRELQNIVERAVLLGKANTSASKTSPQVVAAARSLHVAAGSSLKDVARRSRTADHSRSPRSPQLEPAPHRRRPGINRTTLYKKMKRLGLEPARSSR